MIFSRALIRFAPGIPVAVFVAAVLGPASSSMAGLTLGSSSGSAFFSLFDIAPTTLTTLPSFNSLANGGAMLSPGFGIPTLTGDPLSPNQTMTSSTLSPKFDATSNNSSVPGNFGTASTEIYAATAGQEGASTTQGGVFWNVTNSLADDLPNPIPGQPFIALAAVSVSTGMATFTNPSTASNNVVLLLPGATLSVNGTINNSDGSYVAAGLSTSITLSGGTLINPITTQLDSIAMAGNNFGAFAVSGITPSGAIIPSNPKESASASLSATGLLTATGTSFASSSIVLTPGESITITSVLTLISDPGSSIGISSTVDPKFAGDLPDFGSFAGPSVVPEPSTFVLLGSGLAAAAAWSRFSRRRASPKT